MNLIEATKQLEQLGKDIQKQLPITTKLENEYYKKYYDHLIHSTLPSADKREAEVRELLQMDGIIDGYLEAKLQMRLLLTQKDILIELCKNLRALQNHDN